MTAKVTPGNAPLQGPPAVQALLVLPGSWLPRCRAPTFTLEGIPMSRELPESLARLTWMREQRIWPNGLRYLWTDAFGVVQLVSLYHELGEERFLWEAEWVVSEVERVLGRPHGLRIGEAPDREGQYFHYLAMWLYALGRLGAVEPRYLRRALQLAHDIHPHFVLPGRGVIWKMREDLSGPAPGSGLGALDAFHGYVVYRLLDPEELASEIADMQSLIERGYRTLRIDQDLGLGMMLWMTHFFPDEPWARFQREVSLAQLEQLWVPEPGYFCRASGWQSVRFAFTNYGVSLGLQAVGAWPERVRQVNRYFQEHLSGDEYEHDAITHVMACASHFPGELLALRPAPREIGAPPP